MPTANVLSPALVPAASPHLADQPRRLRSVGAIAAGLVSIFAVTTAIDVALHATDVFPPIGAPPMSHALFALAFGYRFVIDVARRVVV